MSRLGDFLKKQMESGSGEFKFISEETRYENGEVHIKRVVKSGKEAEKEIEKHMGPISDQINDAMKQVNEAMKRIGDIFK